MTLYLYEIHKKSRSLSTVYVLVLSSVEKKRLPEDDIVARWPHDGTEERRQQVLRFIERWAAERNITIGNPEIWSLEGGKR